MGYDLHMERKPESVPEGYRPQYEGQPEHYRINAGAARVLVALMVEAEALSLEPAPEPPAWPPPGMEAERASCVLGHLESGTPLEPAATAAERASIRAYEEGLEEHLRRGSAEPGKVPVHKLRSNDGWWVSPDECRSLDRALRRFADELTEGLLRAIMAPFEEESRRLAEHYRRVQGFVPLGVGGPPLSLEAARGWLAELAAYNALAADHGGYRVR